MPSYEHVLTPKKLFKTHPVHRGVIIEYRNNSRYSDWKTNWVSILIYSFSDCSIIFILSKNTLLILLIIFPHMQQNFSLQAHLVQFQTFFLAHSYLLSHLIVQNKFSLFFFFFTEALFLPSRSDIEHMNITEPITLSLGNLPQVLLTCSPSNRPGIGHLQPPFAVRRTSPHYTPSLVQVTHADFGIPFCQFLCFFWGTLIIFLFLFVCVPTAETQRVRPSIGCTHSSLASLLYLIIFHLL